MLLTCETCKLCYPLISPPKEQCQRACSKNLKKEKTASEELLKTNKQLTDSLLLIKTELKTLKNKNIATPKDKDTTIVSPKNNSSKDSIRVKKEFVLPKEN